MTDHAARAGLDGPAAGVQGQAMTENRYAMGLDALEAGVRVGPADQVAAQPVPDPPPADWRPDPQPYADGAGGDVDGD
ncbi:hypothetical protein [Blastococcus montanus]|uniref:hypothetical protein n=1 Tax=Blastococcus montanus TaxID=3144973 RepID=UPI0032099D00